MAAPYWGQLPPIKTGQTRARRLSDDLSPADHRQSLDGAVQGAPSKSNRVSVQTTKSDAPTDSTFSPFVSPTASSFQDQGLAPRPPSLPYGASQYTPDLLEIRRRRRSRNQDQEFDYPPASGPPLPAAPEVPRAPPSSYKYPPGHVGPPYTYPVPPPGPPRPRKQMSADENQVAPAPVPGFVPVNQKQGYGDGGRRSPRAQRNSTDPTIARNALVRDETNSHRRRASGTDYAQQHRSKRASMSQPGDRAKMFANERSPLQRLELTLDSISKEDKRARVEAAERAAREKAAANGTPQQQPQQHQQQPQQPPHEPQQPQEASLQLQQQQQDETSPSAQQVHFRDRQPSATVQEEPKSQIPRPVTPVTPTRPPHNTGGQRGPLSQNPPEEGRQYGSGSVKSPRTHAPESRIPVPSSPQSSGIPQRNLSFRERAAKNDVKLPNGFDGESPNGASPAVTTPTNGASVSRSGSNKLKKNPPGDPWYSKRNEVEERYPTIEIRNPQPINPAPRAVSGPTTPVAPGPGTGHAHTNGAGLPGSRLPPARTEAIGYSDDDYYDDDVSAPPMISRPVRVASQKKADQILGRVPTQHAALSDARRSPPPSGGVARGLVGTANAVPQYEAQRETRSDESESDDNHTVTDLIYGPRHKLAPGQGLFKPTKYLDEWKKATVGTLSGSLLDLDDVLPVVDKAAPWWESPQSKRRNSMSSRPKKAEAFEGEYDDTNAPTRFKPPLYLKCGPLLRYCGIRHEHAPAHSNRNGPPAERDIWRGSVMIVTTDADSSYDIAPTLRLFVQPLELLPQPPRVINGDEPLAPEYVDPIAGHPKLGRKGETLYVRPVDHLEEARDLSRDETDEGLFEKARSPPDMPLPKGVVDPPGSFAARRKRVEMDGEKAGKYKDVRGFRLHAERGYTFWRFNIEVELRDKQQRIAYRINRGPSTGFWVPAKGEAMNIMFHSCNGFSLNVDTDQFSGPDPMWRDVLNTHQSQPFHVMIGGGDQIYNDKCMQETKYFKAWLEIKNPLHKHHAEFPPQMQNELEHFYLERYAMWFSQGLFGMANSQIPMVNMFDDHDIIDGFGSYSHHFMDSPVFSGVGNVAFKYYMLFQHQSVPDETEKSEPSWSLGKHPGPYINEVSRSLFMHLGAKVALLAVDARTERGREEVISRDTWKDIIDRCFREIERGKTEHLLVVLGVPIAYPRLVWLENILTSRLLDPIKALGKTGVFGNFLNHFDGGVEVLDDLDDHWTAKKHKEERATIIEELQDLAALKSIRVTILSGDVHLAAIGQFYSNPKLGIAKHRDYRYMPNVISSAIVNAPPPDLLADVLNKRNKVHHFNKETDEDMIPIFGHGVDGKPRNNKHLLPHRNWCSIREYVPGNTPPTTPTPGASTEDLPPRDSPSEFVNERRPSGIFRRFSLSRNRAASFRGPDGVHDRSRPPISGGGFLRTLSSRRGVASADEVGRPSQHQQQNPGFLKRTLSASSVTGRFGSLFRRRGSTAKRDDGGINGAWGVGSETEEEYYDDHAPRPVTRGGGGVGMGLRGGGSEHPPQHEFSEFADGDESYFSVRSETANNRDNPLPPEPMVMSGGAGGGVTFAHPAPRPAGMTEAAPEQEAFAPKPFHRTPTGLSAKQMKHADQLAVDLQGGLEVCLNVEISPHDPAGITVPYRLVVPKLWYDYEVEEPWSGEEEEEHEEKASPMSAGGKKTGRMGSLKRFLSLKKG
ncbi:hypothetical protein B0T19DRAFT_26561 [Cercophora scortea]|uniref:PhoD-like phosphatase domain-containing protein n=1 Tax=Cercophora scortea TaxID=314031 RepID=A0AAE0J377_9PEZI|nr:hypothetical protein B0T19DRAFT_26561 [Cercophora scortea]